MLTPFRAASGNICKALAGKEFLLFRAKDERLAGVFVVESNIIEVGHTMVVPHLVDGRQLRYDNSMHSACILVITPEETFKETANTFLLKVIPSERWSCLPEALDSKKVDNFLEFAGLSGQNKRAVLAGADNWNLVIANRLLKILEEPPNNLTVLVLSASEKILPTVASRLSRRLSVSRSVSSNQNQQKQVINSREALSMRDALLLIASSHTGHDHAKILQAADSHL